MKSIQKDEFGLVGKEWDKRAFQVDWLKAFKVKPVTISAITSGRNWKHVKTINYGL